MQKTIYIKNKYKLIIYIIYLHAYVSLEKTNIYKIYVFNEKQNEKLAYFI